MPIKCFIFQFCPEFKNFLLEFKKSMHASSFNFRHLLEKWNSRRGLRQQLVHRGNISYINTTEISMVDTNQVKQHLLTWRSVRATNASITGPLSSFSKWTSSMISSLTSIESDISLLLRVITSHFSGVVTIIWRNITRHHQSVANQQTSQLGHYPNRKPISK